jgi:hypothetical protein
VVGDVGLVLAAFFVFRELGTFDFLESFDAARETFATNEGVVVAICCLMLGSMLFCRAGVSVIGGRDVVYKVQTSTRNNPFALPALTQFACPSAL